MEGLLVCHLTQLHANYSITQNTLTRISWLISLWCQVSKDPAKVAAPEAMAFGEVGVKRG